MMMWLYIIINFMFFINYIAFLFGVQFTTNVILECFKLDISNHHVKPLLEKTTLISTEMWQLALVYLKNVSGRVQRCQLRL